jgi:hypothetical protein
MTTVAAAISVAGSAVATRATIAASTTVSTSAAVATRAAAPTSAAVATGAAIITGSAVATCAASAATATSAAGSASAACSRVAAIRNRAATAGATSVTDATRRANHRTSGFRIESRIAADRAGHSIGLIPVAGPVIHFAQSLGEDGATADFLALYDTKAAVAVHGWIGHSRYALGSRSKVLGRGWGADSEEEGCTRQGKSVRALHVFTYIISQL